MAQETYLYHTPWIQEIKLPSQYTDIPNRSFYLDDLGHLFIGKENGLTIVNGRRSIHLHMDGPVYIAGGCSDSLYYTSGNDVGYLIMDEKLGFHTLSFLGWIPSAHRTFIPSGLVCIDNSLFMNTDRGVYHLSNGRAEFFSFQMAETRLHRVGDDLYLAVDGTGIMYWSGDRFEELVDQEQIGGDPAILLGIEENRLQVLTSAGAVYSMTDSDSTLLKVASFPAMNRIAFIEHINEELVLVGTHETGMSIHNHEGRQINKLGNKGGLPDRDIQQVYASKDHEIWILGPHSLHKINYPSLLNVLEINPSIIGRILASVVVDDRIILGSSHGVFSVERNDTLTDKWHIEELTPGQQESIHLLAVAGEQLFAAGSGHLYSIHDNKTEILDEGRFTGIQALNKNSVVASSNKGIIRCNRTDHGWKITSLDPSLSSSHFFVKHKDDVFFLCGNGVYRLSRDLKDAVSIPFHMDELLFRLLPVDNELYLVGNNLVYLYEEDEETFLPLPWDHKAEVLSGSDIIFPDKTGDYWIVQHNGKYSSRVINAGQLEEISDDRKSFPVLQNLGEIISLTVVDSILFITGKDKVSLFDLRKLNSCNGEVPLRIERMKSADTGELDLDLPSSAGWFSEQGELILSHASNDIEVSLAGLEFQSAPEPLFRYKLLPGQERWSGWSNNREMVFIKLRHGEYRFVAQAKDLYGRVSAPAELLFTIKPPFYRTWYAYTSYGILLLVGLFLFQKWRLLSYQRAENRGSQRMQIKLDNLTVEKEKSDKLVAEVLPERTVTQLKTKGKSKWDKYERTTVLFSDIQGFTKIAEEMNPEALIDELDKFFFHFDSVVEKYNIEKIKTIGDAYMAAGGIPKKNSTNPVEVVLAALEMQSYMQHLKTSKTDIWDLRIGIHTGPVIAGVVGHKKVSYDIWGDTVNTASRMESSGIAGKVNISGITYGMVKDYFICEYRGKLPVKYKGNIDMYFVNGLRPELSVDLKGIPNKRFFIKLQLLRLGDLEEKVLDGILTELPPKLHFHRLEYARKVYNQAFLLARAEEMEQEERLLIRTAALLLFTGLTQSFNNFENRSSVIAREILPNFQYSERQIDQICNLILATKQPFNPHNQMEKILIDAKMEYIGCPDYPTEIKLLFQELKEAGAKINGQQFKKQQLELLFGFDFFTITGQRLREVPGPDQMAILEEERWI
ncbi:MAG: hypothetical protein KAR19_15470 [Bacteroidales bacterium]|nr:hypothetical protein [Bacteroidales bacterium]